MEQKITEMARSFFEEFQILLEKGEYTIKIDINPKTEKRVIYGTSLNIKTKSGMKYGYFGQIDVKN